jgi:16S rRNA (cytosine967-C5)-methyltransferase
MTAAPRVHRPVLTAILAALQSVFGKGALAEQVVDEVLRHQPKWGARDRRLFASSVYDLVRWWRREAWRAGVPDGDSFGPAVDAGVTARIWAAWWRSQGGEVPDFPELSGVPRGEPGEAPDLADAPPAIRASLPDWLDTAGAAAMGEAWSALRDTLNEPAEVWLRANTLRATPAQVVQALAAEGVTALTAPADGHPDALVLAPRRRLATSATMQAGWFEVQDAGSQEIAPFLQPRPGEVVIDSCAGAGGKTLHLAALLHNHGRLLALDVHPWKLAALEKRAARAGVTCLQTQPITSPEDLARHAGTADRLLIDAPCSGLGVLRRHPDTKWKLTPAELARLLPLQQEILDAHCTLLKPGGTLVYATCSFLPEENTAHIRAFLARQPAGAWSLEEERLLLPDPARPAANHDAFYMARLRSVPR